MKKSSLLAIALASLVSLVGCGNKPAPQPEPPGPGPEPPDPPVVKTNERVYCEFVADLVFGPTFLEYVQEITADDPDVSSLYNQYAVSGSVFGVQFTYSEEFTPADLSADILWADLFVGTAEEAPLWDSVLAEYENEISVYYKEDGRSEGYACQLESNNLFYEGESLYLQILFNDFYEDDQYDPDTGELLPDAVPAGVYFQATTYSFLRGDEYTKLLEFASTEGPLYAVFGLQDVMPAPCKFAGLPAAFIDSAQSAAIEFSTGAYGIAVYNYLFVGTEAVDPDPETGEGGVEAQPSKWDAWFAANSTSAPADYQHPVQEYTGESGTTYEGQYMDILEITETEVVYITYYFYIRDGLFLMTAATCIQSL